MAERKVLVYTRFNRLWHWSQATSILILLFTGLRIMGLHGVLTFGTAVTIHSIVAVALMLLWVFTAFWLMTTGAWRQFAPRRAGLWQVARFYAWGVFRGEDHPYRKVLRRRHNPLQALAYLALKVLLFPAVFLSGIAYLGYTFWDHLDPSGWAIWAVANIHILAAFAIAAFVVAHVYLLTIGHGFREHVKPMVTGFEDIDLTPEQEAYLAAEEPGRLKA
ncbi:cytochrome b/b6 domain-containing protein [Paracoccus thiocyanatus]|uniref:Cytochrome B n=1 Tax=Paracoccus thiocyanatus TaxID=34006 RepID=A0A1N6N615_9RHOB|nr:cytochrome b/b6 domain-containing protein [Paracoccus thiocyanatus]RDW13501.1 cytochrome B [Paracoccus thiocyanatus]SIP87449.1 Thiosulfate reductase cytochrome b subunit [Paracoccus thiocyanatus]